MKKIQFAKIFELETHQVLITKDYEDHEKFKVNQITDLEDCMPTLALVFDDEEKRDKCFDDYNEENAKKFLANILKMLG